MNLVLDDTLSIDIGSLPPLPTADETDDSIFNPEPTRVAAELLGLVVLQNSVNADRAFDVAIEREDLFACMPMNTRGSAMVNSQDTLQYL
jgi:hypothetical protein